MPLNCTAMMLMDQYVNRHTLVCLTDLISTQSECSIIAKHVIVIYPECYFTLNFPNETKKGKNVVFLCHYRSFQFHFFIGRCPYAGLFVVERVSETT